MKRNVFLVPINRDGVPRGYSCLLSDVISQVLHATAELYTSVGFEEPWIGYLAHVDKVPVGTCGFKSAPCNGRVEIAYFTFPGFEGHGYATAMAIELIAIARRNMPSVIITAQTLPNRNASHRVSFVEDYLALIDRFRELDSHPRIWICLPVPAYDVRWDIRNDAIVDEIMPMIREVADRADVPLIDMFVPLSGHEDLFPDEIHPNVEGAEMIAREVRRALIGT